MAYRRQVKTVKYLLKQGSSIAGLLFCLYIRSNKRDKMKKIVTTIQERWAATRPNIYNNKKKYNRKKKHRNDSKNN